MLDVFERQDLHPLQALRLLAFPSAAMLAMGARLDPAQMVLALSLAATLFSGAYLWISWAVTRRYGRGLAA